MLKLSTKERYAVRIMVCLATRNDDHPARKQEISDSEDISPDYVVQIMMKLRTAGLVVSHRGVNGGFALAKAPDRITVTDVLEAVEGPIALVPCLNGPCKRASSCVTRYMWQKAGAALKDTFSGVTIGEMAKQSKELGTASFAI